MRMLRTIIRRFAPPEPDPIVGMLVRELNEAARSLDVASTAMKHNRATPMVITETRAAFRRCASIAHQAAAARQIELQSGERRVEEYASVTSRSKAATV